jgi:hypothetical protein
MLAAAVIIGIFGAVRGFGPMMDRPLGHDEFLTLEYYTWAGIAPSGEARPIRRATDVGKLSRPGGTQFALGVYRSLGVWKEPNNQVFHSLLMNFAMLRGHPSWREIRIPALLGSLMFAALCALACATILRSPTLAPIVAAAALALPYTVHYGETARGYSWMMALQTASILLAFHSAARPASILRAASCAACTAMTTFTVVSLAVDWMPAFYLALWLCPPVAGVDRRIWRKNLLGQILAVAAVLAVFGIDRLPYIVSGFRQYGTMLAGPSDALLQARPIFGFLFPMLGWKVFAAACAVGLLASLRSAQIRFLGVSAILVIAIGGLHFAVARNLPYIRTFGYLLPLALLGFAEFVGALALIKIRRMSGVVYGVAAVAVALLMIHPIHQESTTEPSIKALQQLAAGAPGPNPVRAVLPPIDDYILKKFLPPDWLDDEDQFQIGSPLDVAFFVENRGGWGMEMQKWRAGALFWRPLPDSMRPAPGAISGDFGLVRESSMIVESKAPGPHFPVLVMWHPDPTKLGLDASGIMELLGASDIPYIRRNVRVPAKLEFYSQLDSVEFLALSDEELFRIRLLVNDGIKLFGGSMREVGAGPG